MTVWGALAGGFAGTLVMTTLLRAASELGLTRIDIPFLLGTAVSVDRTRAKVVGFALHFAAGLLFALLYYASFVAINRSGWWIGAGFGVFHALFAGTTLRKLPRQAVSAFGDCAADDALGRNVSGGFRPRLSCGRSLL